MIDQNKKSEERVIMDYFMDCHDGFPKGKLLASESPDFLLKINPKKALGIELTKLHDPEDSKNSHEDQNYFPVKDIDKQLLNEIIQSKEEKLWLYNKKKINDCWLIIYIDVLEGPSSFNLNNKIEKWDITSDFKKVFLFELFSPKVYELV